MKGLDLQSLAETAIAAARSAGRIISQSSNQKIEVEHKDGGHSYASQVVTEVDRKAQDAILEILNSASDEYDFALLTEESEDCLLYTSPSPRDYAASRMPSSA